MIGHWALEALRLPGHLGIVSFSRQISSLDESGTAASATIHYSLFTFHSKSMSK